MLSSVLLAGATVASLATLAAAQNSTSEAECHSTVQDLQQGNVTFNATGSAPMKSASFQDWHISIGMDYILARNTSIVRDVHSLGNQYMLLSLPESVVETMKEEGDGPQICYYQMDPRNATAEADDDGEIPPGSCDGILSEECQEDLRNAPMPDNDGCPRIDIGDVCGGPMRLWSSNPMNLSAEANCTIDSLEGIDIPRGYITYSLMYQGILLPPEEDAFLEAYDLHVRQPLPMLITARLGGGRSAVTGPSEAICLAADGITEGSREPEGDFPPNGAMGSDATWAMVAAFALTCASLLVV